MHLRASFWKSTQMICYILLLNRQAPEAQKYTEREQCQHQQPSFYSTRSFFQGALFIVCKLPPGNSSIAACRDNVTNIRISILRSL
jgi:hypothetical protein